LEEIDNTPTEDEKERNPNSFYENFDDGDSEGWLITRGKGWQIENNRYCTAGRGGEHRTLAGDTGWTDYTVSTQAELKKGKGFGLYFRATGNKKLNAYIFQYDPGYGRGAFLFRQVINGRERSPFARSWAPKEYQWYNQARTISVRVTGNTFTAYIDGNQVLQGTHSDYTQGQIGLRTWSSSQACFDDITVTPPNNNLANVVSLEY
jgi:fructan beta-fructosidase